MKYDSFPFQIENVVLLFCHKKNYSRLTHQSGLFKRGFFSSRGISKNFSVRTFGRSRSFCTHYLHKFHSVVFPTTPPHGIHFWDILTLPPSNPIKHSLISGEDFLGRPMRSGRHHLSPRTSANSHIHCQRFIGIHRVKKGLAGPYK